MKRTILSTLALGVMLAATSMVEARGTRRAAARRAPVRGAVTRRVVRQPVRRPVTKRAPVIRKKPVIRRPIVSKKRPVVIGKRRPVKKAPIAKFPFNKRPIKKRPIKKVSKKKFPIKKKIHKSFKVKNMIRWRLKHRHYCRNFGVKFRFGFCYRGFRHSHWARCVYMPAFDCYHYLCPCTNVYYVYVPSMDMFVPVKYYDQIRFGLIVLR